jgi:hypothetical protein
MEAASVLSHLLGGLAGPLTLAGALATTFWANGRTDAVALAFAISMLVMPIFLVLSLLEGWPPQDVPLATLIAFIAMVVISQLLLFIRRRPPAEHERGPDSPIR